jgi:hypothetical protein
VIFDAVEDESMLASDGRTFHNFLPLSRKQMQDTIFMKSGYPIATSRYYFTNSTQQYELGHTTLCIHPMHHCTVQFNSIQFNSIQLYSCSTISTTGKVTSQIKSCTSHCAVIKYKRISMKLDTHYIYIYIYIYK